MPAPEARAVTLARPGEGGASTRERILDAAEALFAEHGIAAVGVRRITRAAGVNVASVNYHFGSKDNLVSEVFRRRIGEVRDRRLALLDAAEARAAGRRPSVEAVMNAYVTPMVELGLGPDSPHRNFVRLMARRQWEPLPEGVSPRRFDELADQITRFRAALAAALGYDDPEAAPVFQALQLARASTHQVVAMLTQKSGKKSGPGKMTAGDPDQVRAMLVGFITGGIEALARRQMLAPSG